MKFYRKAIHLNILFTTPDLTCFEFGGSYLMVEKDYEQKPASLGDSFYLRMNVPDVHVYKDYLKRHGVEMDYHERYWGTVLKFSDPEDNLLAFKDDAKFEALVQH